MTARTVSILALAMLSVSSFAQEREKTKADTNREVIRTYAKLYSEAGQYDRADELLWTYLNHEGEDYGLWVLLGQTQLQEKKWSQACYAFQKATTLTKNPQEHVYAEYGLADCMNQGGRTTEAKNILRQIIPEESGFSESAETSLAMMNNGRVVTGSPLPGFRLSPKGRWRVSGAIGSGFDTNVLLVEQDVADGVSTSDRGSFFISPGAQVSYSGKAWGNDFETRYLASYTDYLNKFAQPFNAFYQRADLSLGTGNTRYGFYADTYFLNKDAFQIYDYEVGVDWSRTLKSTSHYSLVFDVPLQYQKYLNAALSTPDNDRTGGDMKLRATNRWAIGDVELVVVQLSLDGQWTKGVNYHEAGFDLPIQWVKPLPFLRDWGIVNTFGFEAQGIDYFNSDTNRRDLMFRGGAGIVRTFWNTWPISLDYSYIQNVSTLETARYIKGIVNLQVSHQFL